MTWFVSSKTNQGAGFVGQLTVPVSTRVLAQTSSASADYETVIWGSAPFVQQTGLGSPGSNVGHRDPFTGLTARHLLLRAYILPDTVITGVGSAGAGATAQIRIYDSTGTVVGVLLSLAFNSGTNGTALAMTSLGTPEPSRWYRC